MMMRSFFYQECPVCGRHLRVRLEHLGRQLTCTHCQGSFTARDPEMPPAPPPEPAQPDPLSFPGLDFRTSQSVHIGLPR
jgi:hypothetical protein